MQKSRFKEAGAAGANQKLILMLRTDWTYSGGSSWRTSLLMADGRMASAGMAGMAWQGQRYQPYAPLPGAAQR